MIENTRVFEIFRRVLFEFRHGERFGFPGVEAQQWLNNTEQLFYTDPPPFLVTSLASWIRPDMRASRRNAYFRMFGMDLNHGTDDNRPYPYEKAAASNRDFVTIFEEILGEVWRGYINVGNTSGPNATDDSALANLCRRLSEMLTGRRISGNLDREELLFVATMSWFHLTLEGDTPIVVAVKAEGTSPSERLRKIGEAVGLASHGKSDSYFQLAIPIAQILVEIERGNLNGGAQVPRLYTPGGREFDNMMTIITHWSIATGRDIKAVKGPGPMVGVPMSGNGSGRLVGAGQP